MQPKSPWQPDLVLRLLAGLPLAILAAALVAEGLAQAVGLGRESRPAWIVALGTGVLHLSILVWVALLLRAAQSRWRDAFGFGRGPAGRTVAWTLGASVPAFAIVWATHQGAGWILQRLGIAPDAQAAVEALRDAAHGWEKALLLVFAAVTAPVVEEVLFRGIFWPFVRERGWRVPGGIAVSVLFALIHFNLAALLPLTLLGLFWIWLYEKTGNLTAPILSHALFNAANFAWIVLSPAPVHS